MSPEQSIHAGWHDTGEEPVPVRVTESSGKQTVARPISTPMTRQPLTHANIPATGVSPHAMQAAAILGIGIVLLLTALYFGIDSLRGSLTGETGNTTAVEITTDGHFSPASISVAAGSTLSIENKNKDPQVLKVKSGRPLFPVQVLFTTPYTFTVPTDAAGTYTYVSETLADTETLTIVVTASVESAAAPAGTAQNNVASDQIPLPFGDSTMSSAPAQQERVEPAISALATEHSSDTAMIDLATGQTDADVSLSQNQLPTNPYTVAAAKSGKSQSATIAASAKAKLHSGAPLSQYRPRAVTQTGPELWLLLFPAMFALCIVYRRCALI